MRDLDADAPLTHVTIHWLGGHYAAHDAPDLLVGDIRQLFATLRSLQPGTLLDCQLRTTSRHHNQHQIEQPELD